MCKLVSLRNLSHVQVCCKRHGTPWRFEHVVQSQRNEDTGTVSRSVLTYTNKITNYLFVTGDCCYRTGSWCPCSHRMTSHWFNPGLIPKGGQEPQESRRRGQEAIGYAIKIVNSKLVKLPRTYARVLVRGADVTRGIKDPVDGVYLVDLYQRIFLNLI